MCMHVCVYHLVDPACEEPANRLMKLVNTPSTGEAICIYKSYPKLYNRKKLVDYGGKWVGHSYTITLCS